MRWFRLTEALYDLRYASATQLQTIAESIVFTFALYTALFMMGYMITLAYYRMSRWLKLTVSIGVPALLVLVYPLVDQLLLQGRISRALGWAISLALGIQAQNYLDRRIVPDAAGGGYGRSGMGAAEAGCHQELTAPRTAKKKRPAICRPFCLKLSYGRSH